MIGHFVFGASFHILCCTSQAVHIEHFCHKGGSGVDGFI